MFFEIKQEIKKLKDFCKQENILDVIITKYSNKNNLIKLNVLILFKNKKENKKAINEIEKVLSKKKVKAGISGVFLKDILDDTVLVKLIQDGFSIKNNKFVSESLGIKILFLITYDLKSLGHSKKTLFGYALKGRKGEKGFLGNIKGQAVGRNNILIPCEKIDEIKEFFETWNVDYSIQKFMKANEKY